MTLTTVEEEELTLPLDPTLSSLIAAATTPLTDTACEQNYHRSNTLFDELDTEISKLNGLTPQAVEWPKVNRLATQILQQQGKDLLAAVYLCRGLSSTNHLAGMLAGVTIVKTLIIRHWQTLYPPPARIKARRSALLWLIEKLVPIAEITTPRNDDDSAIIALIIKDLREIAEQMARYDEGNILPIDALCRILQKTV